VGYLLWVWIMDSPISDASVHERRILDHFCVSFCMYQSDPHRTGFHEMVSLGFLAELIDKF